MKIYNEVIQMDSVKILLSNNPFNTIKNIMDNQEVLIIAPWTPKKEIFNYKKDNFLLNLFNEYYEELPNELIDRVKAFNVIDEISNEYGINLIEYDERLSKIIKDHFRVIDDIIKQDELLNLLKFMSRFSRSENNVVIIGYDEIISKIVSSSFDRINILAVTTNLNNIGISEKSIECVMLEHGNNYIFQISDVELLTNWLENKSGICLTAGDVIDYFSNKTNEKTIIIDKALKNL